MIARLAVLVVLVIAVPAAAQPSPRPGSAEAVRQAKSHYKQGKAFLDQKLYDDAIREFEAAYGLSPLPDLLFNIAQAYRLKGEPDKALVTYQKFLAMAPDSQAADEARTHVAYLTADKERRDAEAKQRADAEAARKAEEAARLQAEAAAATERQRQDQERARRAEEDRKRQEAEAVEHEAAARRQAEIDKREAAVTAARATWEGARAQRSTRRRQGYKLAGVGLGCVGVASIFALVGAHENSSVQTGGFATASDISGSITTGRVSNYFGYAFLVPGVIGLAVGVPLVVLHWDHGDYRVTPIATGEVKGLVLSGTLP